MIALIKSLIQDSRSVDRKGGIFRSGKDYKIPHAPFIKGGFAGLRGGVHHHVHRTSNTADRHSRGGKEPFPHFQFFLD
jgi:hypothetical protein